MKPTTYFVNESPDFNFMLENVKDERIAANKVSICTITEFGLCNDREMTKEEFNKFIKSIQSTTITKKYNKKKSTTKFIESIKLSSLIEILQKRLPE